jgi:two-component system, LytTR family, response regulator
MKRYSALIVDDESIARFNLIKKLRNFSEIDVVAEASGIASAVKAIEALKPDLLFLDIQLSDGNGFDLLDKIDYRGKIIFVTAYDEYAFRAFEINAQDYLLKPISVDRLKNAINRLKLEDQKEAFSAVSKLKYDDRIMIEQKNSIHFLKIESIVLINASKSYTFIMDKIGKKYLVSRSMSEWESRLPEQHFCRVHRNSIVNFNFIEKTEKSGNSAVICMTGIPDPVVVSRGYYKLMKSRYFLK